MDPNNTNNPTNQTDPELSSPTPSVNDATPVSVTSDTAAPTPVDPVSVAAPAGPTLPEEPVSAPAQPTSAPEVPPVVTADPLAATQPTVQGGNGGVKKGPVIVLIVLAVILVGALIYMFATK